MVGQVIWAFLWGCRKFLKRQIFRNGGSISGYLYTKDMDPIDSDTDKLSAAAYRLPMLAV